MTRPVHFEITADDPQRAVKFYREALGWSIGDDDGEGYWLISTGPDSKHGINGGLMGRHFPQAVINTIEVDDLEEATARIEAAGGKRMNGPNEIPGIGMHSYFTDTEGNWFGALEPTQPES